MTQRLGASWTSRKGAGGAFRDILSEAFGAALENPIHFQVIPFFFLATHGSVMLRQLNIQPLPNAFKLLAADFAVACENSKLQPYPLEINPEPAIELTGPRLTWILEDLFKRIARVVVGSYPETGKPSEMDEYLVNLCLEVEVRAERKW